jgi:hypothetical protein
MNELTETATEVENVVADPAETEVAAPKVTEATEEKPSEPSKTQEQIEIERLRRALTKRDRTQGRMHAELEQLRTERARWAERQPVQPQPTQEPSEPNQQTDLRAVVEREAMTLAERIAEQKTFDAKCNSVAAAGNKEFPDFSEALTTLIEEAGPIVGTTGAATPLGEAILDSDSPQQLIHYLGKHPEIAAELDGLSTARIGRTLALIEQEMKAKPKTSTAPKPIEPVVGRATGDLVYSPEMTDAQWLKWRKAQSKK